MDVPINSMVIFQSLCEKLPDGKLTDCGCGWKKSESPVELLLFTHEGVYLQLRLDVVFGLVLPGWRKDCAGLA